MPDLTTATDGPGARQRELLVTLQVRVPDVSAFAWQVDDGRGHRVCGITDRLDRALDGVWDALTRMTEPGAEGDIRSARLDGLAEGGPAYVYGAPLARVHRDPAGVLHYTACETVLDDRPR